MDIRNVALLYQGDNSEFPQFMVDDSHDTAGEKLARKLYVLSKKKLLRGTPKAFFYSTSGIHDLAELLDSLLANPSSLSSEDFRQKTMDYLAAL